MAELNWKHHGLIQTLMSRGPLTEEDFHKLFSSLTGKNPRSSQREFSNYLLKINKELSYVQMELRCCRNQFDGWVFYGLVNNISDDHSKLGTRYSVPQIALFKAVVEAIMQDATARGSISPIDALHLSLKNQVRTVSGAESQSGSQVPAAIRNFSMSQRERAIEELVQDKWLCRTPDGDIGLGIKSYLDLRSWLHNSGVPSCDVCNEIGIKAKVCPNDDCTVRIHNYCLQKKFSGRKGVINCPSCSTQWHDNLPKTEAVHEEDQVNEPTQASQSSELKRRKRGARGNNDTDRVHTSQSGSEFKRVTRASALRT